MKIFGIDPGYGRLGVAIVEKDNRGINSLIYSGCLETDAREDIYERFSLVGKEVVRILEKHKPENVAIESLFLAKNQKTAMRVAEIRGIIIYEAIRKGLPVFEYTPLQIKTAITGDGTSDKNRIIKMVNLLIKIDKKILLDDEYDAMAVALTHSAYQK